MQRAAIQLGPLTLVRLVADCPTNAAGGMGLRSTCIKTFPTRAHPDNQTPPATLSRFGHFCKLPLIIKSTSSITPCFTRLSHLLKTPHSRPEYPYYLNTHSSPFYSRQELEGLTLQLPKKNISLVLTTKQKSVSQIWKRA